MIEKDKPKTMERNRNMRVRKVAMLLLPIFAALWLLGWTLIWIGTRKETKQ